MGTKSSVCPLKPREDKLFGGLSQDLPGYPPCCPKSLRKKSLCSIVGPYRWASPKRAFGPRGPSRNADARGGGEMVPSIVADGLVVRLSGITLIMDTFFVEAMLVLQNFWRACALARDSAFVDGQYMKDYPHPQQNRSMYYKSRGSYAIRVRESLSILQKAQGQGMLTLASQAAW